MTEEEQKAIDNILENLNGFKNKEVANILKEVVTIKHGEIK